MVITHSNLKLRTITLSDLELLRKWRNSNRVNRFLINRKTITAVEQSKWFESIDTATSIYFIILANNEEAGLVYAHNINSVELSFEGSIFIGNQRYDDSFVAVKAALMLTLFFFEQLDYQLSYSTVQRDNTKALDMDRKMGYFEESRNAQFIKSKCSKKDFYVASAALCKALFKNEKQEVVIEPGDKKYSFMQINSTFG